jgi:hypothetical protein
LKRLFLLAALAAISMVPFGGMRLLEYARGIAGDLSVTSVLLLVSAAVAPRLLDRDQVRALGAFVLGGAVLLYPMALGLSSFDPYALGYPARARAILAGLAVFSLYAWWRGRILVLIAILLAIGAYRLGVLESDNLWDYLIDPWLVAGFAGFTIFGLLSKSR